MDGGASSVGLTESMKGASGTPTAANPFHDLGRLTARLGSHLRAALSSRTWTVIRGRLASFEPQESIGRRGADFRPELFIINLMMFVSC